MCIRDRYGVPFEEVLKAIETAAEKIRNHIAEDQKMVRDYKQAKELLTVELVNAEEDVYKRQRSGRGRRRAAGRALDRKVSVRGGSGQKGS